ncbi:MAG: class I SAM-dependent RNA methyltransferase [Alphaproteobacteria bacterium]|nr:class I SAM-dependent RNA methyltransferase [Alphaproteobacteria bacterium]
MRLKNRGGPGEAPPPPPFYELTIDSVGAQGDGVATFKGGPVYIPYTLPGERIRASLAGQRGRLITVIDPSPDRVSPPCPHFGTCGGCAVQHMDATLHGQWKQDLLKAALGRRGIDAAVVAPVEAIPPGQRRRATFAYRHRADGVILGFNARQSDRIIDIAACLLLLPPLTELLSPLRTLLKAVTRPGETGEVTLSATFTGVDLVVTAPGPLDLDRRERLAAFAGVHDLARVSWCGTTARGTAEPVAERRRPQACFAGVMVDLPPGCFLQPSAQGEAAIIARILAAVGERSPVADLYAGVGSFTFSLAQHGRVHAVEGAKEATLALRTAAQRAGLDRITALSRDLAAQPLEAAELRQFAAVVFDPPRAGAMAQARALAEGKDGPPLVVAVSCDPATLARDLRLLMNGGYRLKSVTPIDQFPWSPHLEAVAVLVR